MKTSWTSPRQFLQSRHVVAVQMNDPGGHFQSLDQEQAKTGWSRQGLACLRQFGNLKARRWRRHHGEAIALEVLIEVDVTAHQHAHIGVGLEHAGELRVRRRRTGRRLGTSS